MTLDYTGKPIWVRSRTSRTPVSMIKLVQPRVCRALARAARLSFPELDQADAKLAELVGHEVGRIVIGALPLSRSVILPRALIEFRRQRPRQTVTIVDGTYDDLMAGCISAQQAKAEIAAGLLSPLNIAANWPGRPIGMSFRSDWKPTKAQALLLDLIRESAAATSGA